MSIDFSARARLDKWLWAARFYKTRSLATRAVAAGQVRLNGARTKPAHDVKIDDMILLQLGVVNWEVRVRQISETRGSAGIAQTLYAETEQSMALRAAASEQRKLYGEPGARVGRPTKRDRRQIESVRGGGPPDG